MRNTKFSKYVGIILFVTMLTLIIIASTYAKYTSSFSGTGSATTADWKITLSEDDAAEQTITLTSQEKIYPGQTNVELGKVTVYNKSSLVDAKVTSITITPKDGTPENIKLSAGETTAAIKPGENVEVPVIASWDYTETDETTYADKDLTFDITLTVDQVVGE